MGRTTIMGYDIYHAPDAADGLSADEVQLASGINAYRAANGLAAVPLSLSLSLVAERHVEDIVYNLGGYSLGDPGSNSVHGWSDDPYDARDPRTYPAVWTAPQRLHTAYPGAGYEILDGYLKPDTLTIRITPDIALADWQASPAHNATILNLAPWNTPLYTWNAMGVAILDGVASVWFGHEADPAGTPAADTGGRVFAGYDTTSRQVISDTSRDYTGPVPGLQSEFIGVTPDNTNVSVGSDNWFIHTGAGTDAIAVHGGNNVLDGGTGSNFLVGAGGLDTFFVDARGSTSDTWSTAVNFHAGDAATLWGVTPGSFAINWYDNQGAAGYTGLTLHATAAGKPTASLTLAGYSVADLGNGRLSTSFGSVGGGIYMYVHGDR